MNYKISTYLLLALLIVSLVYISVRPGQSSAQLTTSAQQPFCYNELSEELSKLLKGQRMDRNTGELVHSDKAREDLERLQTTWKINCDSIRDPRVIYGFTFGMNEFKKFAQKTDSLDSVSARRMLGVRVYLSLKEMTVGTNKEVYQDVFLVPLDEKGNDLYDIDKCKKRKHRNGGVVLNTSAPCPNMCQ